MSRMTSRNWAMMLFAVLLAAAGCLNSSDVVAPACSGPIQIEAPGNIAAQETFTATATHNGDGCLNSLSWSVEGSIQLIEASGEEAQFLAVAPGPGTIRVVNPHGNRGEIQIEVDEPETGSPAYARAEVTVPAWPAARIESPAGARADVPIPSARAFSR